MNGWVVLLWSFVAALVILVVGVFAALVLMGRITLFSSSDPESVPSPDATGVVDTSFSVLVLNATPEEGLDVQIRDTLLNSGWASDMVGYGDAGSRDFTTVYYDSEDDALAAIGLADLIGGANVEQSDYYADPADPELKQLVIVIGLDRSSAGAGADTDAE